MSSDQQHGRRGRLALAATAVLLALGGVVAFSVGLSAQDRAPSAPLAARTAPSPTMGAQSPSSPPPSKPKSPKPTLRRSLPVRLDIPSISVHSPLLRLGLKPDGSLEVPPLDRDAPAGWYEESPTPGELGPSVLLGHIDSAKYGPGVFFRLGALRPGATVSVTRADDKVAVFRVQRVVRYPKDHFPTLAVYGNTDHAALRLITCGGRFDPSAGSYEDNTVAYASLISSHQAN